MRMPAAVRKRPEPMKIAASRRRSGFGGVMPKVMMKASAMDSRNFTARRSSFKQIWAGMVAGNRACGFATVQR